MSDRPVDQADGVALHCETCFAIEVPDGFDLDELAAEHLPEDDLYPIDPDSPQGVYREWVIPADVLNAWAKARCSAL